MEGQGVFFEHQDSQGEHPPLTFEEIQQIQVEREVLDFWQEAQGTRKQLIINLGQISLL
jgi:hypothetical protein